MIFKDLRILRGSDLVLGEYSRTCLTPQSLFTILGSGVKMRQTLTSEEKNLAF